MKTPIVTTTISLVALVSSLMLANTAEASCPTSERNQFFASYGDSTQTFQSGVNSVDAYLAALWGWDTNMDTADSDFLAGMEWISQANHGPYAYGNSMVGTDNGTRDANRPIMLAGYDSFSPANVDWAILRFDYYYDHYSVTEGLRFVNASNNDVVFLHHGRRLKDRLIAEGQDRPQWISIRFDLLTGEGFAAEIDAFGNIIAEYGEFMTFGSNPGNGDNGQPMNPDYGSFSAVLTAAKDGVLRGAFFDDMNLSYVAFYGMETVPLQNVWCPPPAPEY